MVYTLGNCGYNYHRITNLLIGRSKKMIKGTTLSMLLSKSNFIELFDQTGVDFQS